MYDHFIQTGDTRSMDVVRLRPKMRLMEYEGS